MTHQGFENCNLVGQVPCPPLHHERNRGSVIAFGKKYAETSVAEELGGLERLSKRLAFRLGGRAVVINDVLCADNDFSNSQFLHGLLRGIHDAHLNGESADCGSYRATYFFVAGNNVGPIPSSILHHEPYAGAVTAFRDASRNTPVNEVAGIFERLAESQGVLLGRGTLTSDPKAQAELYQNLGEIYEKLGKFDPADSLLRLALDQRKSLFGADSPEVAESLVALGLLRSGQAHLEEAEQLVRQGLEMDRRHLARDHPAVAKALLAYGRVLAQRGSYDQAIQSLSEAVRIESAPGVAPTDLAASLSALADAQYSAGHYDICEALYRRVLEMHRQLYGARHPLVAEDLGNLGSVKEDLGYYSEAEQFDRQALEITESYYGKNHPNTATELTMLGRSLEYQNKFDQSVEAFP